MRTLVTFIAAISLSLAMLAMQPNTASAAVSVVGTINGGGTALMTSGPTAGGKSISSFGIHATLFSDGSAQGHFDCVDQMGDTAPGNVFGAITSWSKDATGVITLHITDGKFVAIPGGLAVPGGLPFSVTIQSFGGAGEGHWTLNVGANPNPTCIELLISGQIVARWN